MPRLNPVDPASAEGKAKELFEGPLKGKELNIFKAMANSPAALNAYVQLSGALKGASLSPKEQEVVQLAIGEQNDCNYCTAAHATIAGMHGVSDDEIQQARQAEAPDAREAAILGFARAVVERKGWVDDATLQASRDAGVTDRELLETVAVVSQNVFSNYVNHLADTEVDFPAPQPAGTT